MTPAEPLPGLEVEREVEQKFRVHGLFRLPDLLTVEGVGAVEDRGAAELESAYFDTADLRLAREGITLRRRAGDDEGWHLKLPADSSAPDVRDEIRLPLSAADDQPPAELLRLVRVIVRTSPVTLVSTLRTHRATLLIRTGKGKPIAELVDDTVHVIGTDGTITARFRELELERRKGGKTLPRVAAALTSAGAVGGEFVAKVVRALGPTASGHVEVPAARPSRPSEPAGTAIAAYLATQVRALRSADMAFRRDPETGGEAVHQMRVAARRLRGGLRTFRPLLDRRWAGQLRDELTWFAHGLNGLREAEVLRSRLKAHAAELPDDVPADPVRDFLDAALDAEEAKARDGVLRLLDSERYLGLHDALVSAATEPVLGDDASMAAAKVLPGLVQDAWNRLSRSADALTEDSPAPQWHDVRLRAKRARYAAEAVAPTLGDDATAFARQMRRLTEVLGEHQDAIQAAELVHRLAPQHAEPEIVFALGALATLEHDHARAARQRFATIWAQARRAKWRQWL